MLDYTHILYATNLDETCKITLKRVVAFAGKINAKVTVTHVVQPVLAAYPYGCALRPDDLEGSLVEESQKILAELLKSVGLDLNCSSTKIGNPDELILEQAESLKCDVIILNGHTHNAFGRLGSSADIIINKATCDVIILRSKA